MKIGRTALLSILLVTALLASGCATYRRVTGMGPFQGTKVATAPARPVPMPLPQSPPAAPVTPDGTGAQVVDLRIVGAVAELKAAMAEPSAVRYDIRVAEETPGKSVSDAFEDLLAREGSPAADTLLLVIFPEANYDLRFAMGAIFSQKQVPVDETLALVRSEYFPESRKGDPARGLTQLIRAVNQRLH